MDPPQLPPLFSGEQVPRHTDPFREAVRRAITGIDSGSIFYSEAVDRLTAALVLAPETRLQEAIQAVYVVQVGLAESLTALAPAEVQVSFQWPDRFKINGADCGGVRFVADVSDPRAHPKWLVIGIEVHFLPIYDELSMNDELPMNAEPGANPNSTCLYEEGCGEIAPMTLLESWSRHTLLWLTYYMDSGFERVLNQWRPRCDSVGSLVEQPRPGLFVGLDEQGRMLLRQGGMTETLSLIEFAQPRLSEETP